MLWLELVVQNGRLEQELSSIMALHNEEAAQKPKRIKLNSGTSTRHTPSPAQTRAIDLLSPLLKHATVLIKSFVVQESKDAQPNSQRTQPTASTTANVATGSGSSSINGSANTTPTSTSSEDGFDHYEVRVIESDDVDETIEHIPTQEEILKHLHPHSRKRSTSVATASSQALALQSFRPDQERLAKQILAMCSRVVLELDMDLQSIAAASAADVAAQWLLINHLTADSTNAVFDQIRLHRWVLHQTQLGLTTAQINSAVQPVVRSKSPEPYGNSPPTFSESTVFLENLLADRASALYQSQWIPLRCQVAMEVAKLQFLKDNLKLHKISGLFASIERRLVSEGEERIAFEQDEKKLFPTCQVDWHTASGFRRACDALAATSISDGLPHENVNSTATSPLTTSPDVISPTANLSNWEMCDQLLQQGKYHQVIEHLVADNKLAQNDATRLPWNYRMTIVDSLLSPYKQQASVANCLRRVIDGFHFEHYEQCCRAIAEPDGCSSTLFRQFLDASLTSIINSPRLVSQLCEFAQAVAARVGTRDCMDTVKRFLESTSTHDSFPLQPTDTAWTTFSTAAPDFSQTLHTVRPETLGRVELTTQTDTSLLFQLTLTSVSVEQEILAAQLLAARGQAHLLRGQQLAVLYAKSNNEWRPVTLPNIENWQHVFFSLLDRASRTRNVEPALAAEKLLLENQADDMFRAISRYYQMAFSGDLDITTMPNFVPDLEICDAIVMHLINDATSLMSGHPLRAGRLELVERFSAAHVRGEGGSLADLCLALSRLLVVPGCAELHMTPPVASIVSCVAALFGKESIGNDEMLLDERRAETEGVLLVKPTRAANLILGYMTNGDAIAACSLCLIAAASAHHRTDDTHRYPFGDKGENRLNIQISSDTRMACIRLCDRLLERAWRELWPDNPTWRLRAGHVRYEERDFFGAGTHYATALMLQANIAILNEDEDMNQSSSRYSQSPTGLDGLVIKRLVVCLQEIGADLLAAALCQLLRPVDFQLGFQCVQESIVKKGANPDPHHLEYFWEIPFLEVLINLLSRQKDEASVRLCLIALGDKALNESNAPSVRRSVINRRTKLLLDGVVSVFAE